MYTPRMSFRDAAGKFLHAESRSAGDNPASGGATIGASFDVDRSTADIRPVHQHADAGRRHNGCSYGRTSDYRPPRRATCDASDTNRGQWPPDPCLRALNGQRKSIVA
jgi:hypothetical protein